MLTLSFSGHETFPFRYGWLKKGVDAAANDGAFFSNERAMVSLGVGKNMVQSIKHWCLATNLIDGERNASSSTRIEYSPTEFGQLIISDKGYDAFLEDPATLWLIHWQIATNQSSCPTWFWLFNYWHAVEFSKEQIYSEMSKWIEQNSDKNVSENLLKRDIDCCLRTYVHSRRSTGAAAEESFDCPLTELNLLTELEDGKTYAFRRGMQKTLPDEILLFALDEFWKIYGAGNSPISLEKLAHEEKSPGKIFKIDPESLILRLDKLKHVSNGAFSYSESAGIKQIFRHKETSSLDWLTKYYSNN